MELLVIRHGVALGRAEFASTGKDDDLRPLTTEGRRKMRSIAKGLHCTVGRPDVLATSPLTRAAQTAAILAEVYEVKVQKPVEALRPDAPMSMFGQWVREHDRDATIAIVGHEPHLSCLVGWLMTGDAFTRIALKKGGACLLSFDGYARREAGILQWLMTPSQLKQLGDL